MKKAIMLFLGLILLLVTTGCCRKTVAPIVVPDKDTVFKTEIKHDSTFIDRWHTHYEYIKGDSVRTIDTFFVKQFIEKKIHDTTYVSKEVMVPCEVEKPVEKKLNLWQKTTMWLGNILIFATLGIIAYKIWARLRLKK